MIFVLSCDKASFNILPSSSSGSSSSSAFLSLSCMITRWATEAKVLLLGRVDWSESVDVVGLQSRPAEAVLGTGHVSDKG